MNAAQPIGVFDSGLGGLTVANALLKHLPYENLVYFGDTLHIPYGDKTPESIQQFCAAITHFLLDKGCKAIIIACNTASSVAYSTVVETARNKALVINVIDPVAAHLKQCCAGQKTVGVIGTRRTIESKAYENHIHSHLPEMDVKAMETPLLVPMIEEGFINDTVSQAVLKRYLSHKTLQGIETLILACTHYPIVKAEIEFYYQNKVNVLDTPTVIAQYIRNLFTEKEILNSANDGTHHFYVSKLSQTFEKLAKTFFSYPFRLQEVPTFH